MPNFTFQGESSVLVDTGGASQKVAISTTSATSTAIQAPWAYVTPDVACFVRKGGSTGTITAVSDGTDIYLIGNATQRLDGLTPGDRLAFITATGTGNVYITPGR
jgi:hypothetical protein